MKQPLQIFFVHCLRNGYASFSEMTCFPEMQIRNYQCFFFFPKNSAAGRQPKVVSVNLVLNWCLHIVAPRRLPQNSRVVVQSYCKSTNMLAKYG
jgi:hypothetical protein